MSNGDQCAFAEVGKDWHMICSFVDATLGKDSFIRVDKSSIAFNCINLVVVILLQYEIAF